MDKIYSSVRRFERLLFTSDTSSRQVSPEDDKLIATIKYYPDIKEIRTERQEDTNGTR